MVNKKYFNLICIMPLEKPCLQINKSGKAFLKNNVINLKICFLNNNNRHLFFCVCCTKSAKNIEKRGGTENFHTFQRSKAWAKARARG